MDTVIFSRNDMIDASCYLIKIASLFELPLQITHQTANLLVHWPNVGSFKLFILLLAYYLRDKVSPNSEACLFTLSFYMQLGQYVDKSSFY